MYIFLSKKDIYYYIKKRQNNNIQSLSSYRYEYRIETIEYSLYISI